MTISYVLHPDPFTQQRTQLSPTSIHEYHLKPIADCQDQKEYYSKLSTALISAKERVGMELTVWKDVTGNSEQEKSEGSKTVRVEESLWHEDDSGGED